MRNQIAALKELMTTYTRAQAYAAAVEDVANARYELNEAYARWREFQRINFIIEKGSPAWVGMMLATKPYYRDLVNAKARERRAKQKLLEAVEVV